MQHELPDDMHQISQQLVGAGQIKDSATMAKEQFGVDTPRQIFNYMPVGAPPGPDSLMFWNVDKLRKIAENRKPTHRIDLQHLHDFVWPLDSTCIDETYAKSLTAADLAKPPIVVQYVNPHIGNELVQIVADGNHRLWKRWWQNERTAVGVLLTVHESELCLMTGKDREMAAINLGVSHLAKRRRS